MPTYKTHTAWQWNCRGYRAKRPALQTHLSTIQNPPTVIALQETGTIVKLTGYQTFQTPEYPQIATLVQRNISAEHRVFSNINIPHNFVTLYPLQPDHTKLHVLNLYSSPKNTQHNFKHVLMEALREAGSQPLLVMGDFNAPHVAWGYTRTTKKGRLLWETIQELQLTLHNEPDIPTRIGNSAQRDTAPDLVFSHRLHGITWTPTLNTLGSDHYILETTFAYKSALIKKPEQKHITDWDGFRTSTLNVSPPSNQTDEELERWLNQIMQAKEENKKLVIHQFPTPIHAYSICGRRTAA